MDLFAVVNLDAPRSVTIGVRPLREGETPILQATAGRVVDLVVPEPEGSPVVVPASPLQVFAPAQQMPEAAQAPPVMVPIEVEDSEEEMEEELPLKRKMTGDGEGSSKRPRPESVERPSSSFVQTE